MDGPAPAGDGGGGDARAPLPTVFYGLIPRPAPARPDRGLVPHAPGNDEGDGRRTPRLA